MIRCAACPALGDHRLVGIYTPAHGCRGVAYIICRDCAERLARGDREVLETLDRVVERVLSRGAA